MPLRTPLGAGAGRPPALPSRRAVAAALLLGAGLCLGLGLLLSVGLGPHLFAWPLPPEREALRQAEPANFSEAGVEELLQNPAHGDWRIHRLRGQPAVLVIQFPTLQAQGQAMNRIAALIEKDGGSRERVLSEPEMHALMARGGDNTASYYLGHDYDSASLARFFQLAQTQYVQLNPDEARLHRVLVQAGLLIGAPGSAEHPQRSASAGALVSFSAVQRDDPRTAADESVDTVRRASVLRHELSHGRFFTDAAYRAACWRFWRGLSASERALWRRYLQRLGYDSRNETLMVNETQALLLHTPDARDFDAAALGVTPARLAGMRKRFVPP